MSISTLIRRLGELGATPEMIALAVEEIEADRACLDARRNAARDRKRDQREREKAAIVTGQVTPCHNDVTGRVSLDKEIPPRPPKEINPIPCVSDTRTRGYHRLPEGWRPGRPLPDPLRVKTDLWPPGALEDEIAAFKRWAANADNKNGKGRKLDWDKALWNWIGRQHDERYSRISKQSNPRQTNPTLDILRAANDAIARSEAGQDFGGAGPALPAPFTG